MPVSEGGSCRSAGTWTAPLSQRSALTGPLKAVCGSEKLLLESLLKTRLWRLVLKCPSCPGSMVDSSPATTPTQMPPVTQHGHRPCALAMAATRPHCHDNSPAAEVVRPPMVTARVSLVMPMGPSPAAHSQQRRPCCCSMILTQYYDVSFFLCLQTSGACHLA